MAGRRCATACATWPDRAEYRKCPVCGQDTSLFALATPLSLKDARRRAFDAYYERWDAERSPARLEPGEDEQRFDLTPLPEDWPVTDHEPPRAA